MPDTHIKTGKNYLLQATVEQQVALPHLYSVELHQCFPEAQRPRWQRLVQLNLTKDELANLARALSI